MSTQIVVATILVIVCSVRAAWTLMPASARRFLARHLLKLPLPQSAAAMLRKHLSLKSGCAACDGCDKAVKKPEPAAIQTIRFHAQPRR